MTCASAWEEVDWPSHQASEVVDGHRIGYVDYGEGPPVVLIHGLGGSWQTWLENIPALGEHRRVIAIDLPGFGTSDQLSAKVDFSYMVKLVWALLDRLRVAPAALFGHSFGGLVCLAMAAEAPERVTELVLVSGGGAEMSKWRLRLIFGVSRIAKLTFNIPGLLSAVARNARWRRVFLALAVSHPSKLPPALAIQIVPLANAPGIPAAIRLGGTALRKIRLEAIRPRALLIWGGRDRLLPVQTVARRLADGLPNAHLEVLDDVGHCAMFEAPEKVNELALSFLNQEDVRA